MCKADINQVMDLSYVEPESLLLKCPKCGARLRPLLLDMFEERGENYQKIWWTCRNLKNKTCIFPLNMPPDVFWTKRNEEQIRHNVIPLPNYNLLPDDLKDMYPFLKNKKIMVSKPRSSSKPTSKGNGIEIKPRTEKTAVQQNDDLITRPEPAKTPEDEVLEKIPSPPNKEQNFEELKEHETERRIRKRKNKSEVPVWGKKQLRGVVSNSTVNGGKAAVFPSLHDMKRMTLKPFQERIVTGGRNFDYNIVDESVPTSSSAVNRVQLFPDIQSSLKSALALRFAKKDYMNKVNTLFGDTGTASNRNEDSVVEKRKLLAQLSEQFPTPNESKEINSPRSSSQDEDGNTDGSETASSRGSDKTENSVNEALFKASSKTFNAFRDVEQKISLSTRLGIRLPTEKLLIKSDLQEPTNEIFEPLSVQSGDVSIPSTSNLSVDSSTQINPPVQERISTNFDSPELHNIVQKHLLLLRTKTEKKKKRKNGGRRTTAEDTSSRSSHPHGQESHEPLFDFGMQDEQDYGIFALGDNDDAYGYDVFNF
jgi:hypothetical protein